MKKNRLLAILLVLALMFSLLPTAAFATETPKNYIDDPTDEKASAFKSYVEGNSLTFTDDYFFMAEFQPDTYMQEPERTYWTKEMGIKISTSSEATLDACVGLYKDTGESVATMFYPTSGKMHRIPTVDIQLWDQYSALQAQVMADPGNTELVPSFVAMQTELNKGTYKASVSDSNPTKINTQTTYRKLFNIVNASDGNYEPVYVGFALQNPSALKENTTVTVELYCVTNTTTPSTNYPGAEYTWEETPIRTVTYTFTAPVAKIGTDEGAREFTSLAAALIAAQSGDTIKVLEGTYGADEIGKLDEPGSYTNANIVRYKSLTIQPAEGATVKFTGDVSLGYDDSSTANATMTVKGFTFENASLSLSNYVQATVEDCTFSGNGNAAGALVINDSCCKNHKTTEEYPASQVTVKNCTIDGTKSGDPGIRLRNSGNVTLTNNTVNNAKHDGILFESNTSNNNTAAKTISVTGNHITEWNAENETGGGRGIRASFQYTGYAPLADGSTVTIKDNYFTKETLGLDTPDFMKITGVGSATVDLDHNYWNNKILTAVNGKSDLYTVDGATPTINTVISNATGVAKIGTVEYATLAEAIADVPTNGTETTITMIGDEVIQGNAGVTVKAGQNIVLDLNGHHVSNNATEAKSSATITNKGTLKIVDNTDAGKDGEDCGYLTNEASEGNTGDWWSTPRKNWATNTITNHGTLTLESGSIRNTSTGISYCVDNNSNGVKATFNMTGGKLEDIGCAMRLFCNSAQHENIVNISGGTIESKNSVAFWVQLPGSSGQAKKCSLTISEDAVIKGAASAGYAWYDYSFGDVFDAVQYNVSGGKFNGIIMSEGKTGFITGGLFSAIEYVDGEDTYKIEDYVADGYACVANTDYSTKTAYPYAVKPVQIEMTKNVTAEGDKVKVGGEEINLTLTQGEGATSKPTAAQAKAEIEKVLDNTNVSTFADTNIDKATPATERVQNVDSTGFDLSKVLNAVKEAAAAKSGVTSSVTANDTIQVNAGSTDETFTDADVSKSISIDLTAAAVTTTKQEEQTVVSLSTTTFEVKPIATITVTKDGGETETIKAVIPNEAITAPITFRLPVPKEWSGMVTVYHEGEYYTTCPIQQAGTEAAYVELASKTFSSWTIENEEFEDEDAVAKTDTMYFDSLAEALEAATNGQTVTVLKNCTLNKEVFITNKAITLDLNNCTVAVNTPSIGVPIHVGKKDSTQGAELTVKNGTVNGTTKTDGNVFGVYGMTTDNGAAKRTLTLDGVTLNANEYGVVVNNNSNHGYGAKITVENGSKINAGKSAVAINGKIQDTTGNVPEFVVNGSTLKVTKTGGTYSDEGNAIYAAGYAKWDIDNSTITGATGIYAKAGTFDIVGGKITAEGDAKAPVAYGNGGKSTGDGIIMDSKTGYAGNMTMNLNGVTVSSVNGYAIQEALTDANSTFTESIAIDGGSYTSAVGKAAVATSEAFDRADSTTLTVAGTPTGVTAQDKLGQFTSFNVNYGDGISYGNFSSFLNAAGPVTLSGSVNFATMEAGQQLIANFDVTMGTVSYKTGSMSEFKTIHSGDALDGVANDTAITFQIECGSGVTNTFTFTPHWESVSIPYTLTVKPISGETVTVDQLTVTTETTKYVEYGVYASVPYGTTAMAIGSYNFELNYDTTAFDFDSFTAADDTATVVVNKDTAGKANVGVTLNTAVTPEVASEDGGLTYSELLGTLKLKVKNNTTTTTGVLTTSITNTTGNKPVVTPKGYDKNNGTITTNDHTQYLISFEYVGATGDASKWVLSGTTPTMPTVTKNTGWSLATGASGEGWNPATPVAATEPATYTYTAHHDQYTVTWDATNNPMTVTKTVYGTEGTETVTNGGTMYYEEALTVTPTITGDRTVIRNGDFKYKLGEAAATGVKRTGDTGFTYKVGPSVVNANVALSYTTSEYVTVTFSGGDAVELKNGDTTVTGDALKAIALKSATVADALYASVNDFIKGNEGTAYSIPDQVPKANARLVPPEAKNNKNKQSWKTNEETVRTVANETLTAANPEFVFTADTTLTADAVNTYAVTFVAGSNGSIKTTEPAQVTTYNVDAGTTIAAILAGSAKDYTNGTAAGTPVVLPQTTPDNGYKFKNWTAPESVTAVNAATTITGNFEVAKYNISVSDNATFKGLTGADATGKISMESDVSFKLMLKKNTRIESVSYTVAPNANGTAFAGLENQPLTANENGVYTIPAANILGDVTVTVQTVNTVTVTVKSADAGKGTVGGSTSFVVDKNSEVSAWDYSGLTTTAEPGYEVEKAENKIVFYTDADCTAKFEATQFTADTTLYVNFVDAKYVIELDELVKTNDMEGITAEITTYYVTHGTDAKFKLAKDANDPQIITSVTYSVEGGVQNVLLQPVNGDYTIPGDRIVGKVTVTVKTLATEANINKPIKALFIKRDNEQVTTGEGAYMANVAQNGDMKILALVSEAFKADGYSTANKFFQLANGTQLYWSDRYDAYVCWVSKDMKAADLDGFVKFDATKTATAIVNEGDINFDGTVDSADAGIVNDALHGTRQVPTSALQLFEMDVANSGESNTLAKGARIDANDVTWILQKTVGKTVAKAYNPLWAQPE